MKNKVELVIFLLFAFTFLVYLFPFNAVHAEKFQSGVTIAPSTAETETICDDGVDDDNDGKIDGDDQDCAATPSQPEDEICANGQDDNGDGTVDEAECTQQAGTMGEICANGQDDNGDGTVDEAECTQQADAMAGTCGLQIVSGVPINYGQLNPDQESAEQKVTIKNEGTSQTPAKIMIKGGDWVSDAAGNPTIFPSMNTHVAIAPNLDYYDKKALSSNGWELGGMSGGQSIPVYFQMKPGGATVASLNSFTGSLHQDVTIDLLC
jgi:hypothetical protein